VACMDLDTSPVAREEAAASGRMTSRMTARNERIEVITRGERRRSWTVEQKREIAIESLAPGAAAAEIARKHGIGTGQLYTWRRQLLRGELGEAPQALPRFVQVNVTPTAQQEQAVPKPALNSPRTLPERAPQLSLLRSVFAPDGVIEIILTNGVCIRVGARMDEAVLCRVLTLLEGR
jgi:transposase